MRVSGHRLRTRLPAALALLTAACGDAPTAPTSSPPLEVPVIAREFRGMWVATVANIDWPSRTGLSIPQQQAELVALLDRAQLARLNAVVLQVRAAGDALFPSSLEPWSRTFTGTQGQDPGWDPLAFALSETHRRGLELHAWFNPFRAGNLGDTLRLAATHLGVRRPDLMRRSCGQLWFDPGEAETQDHAMAVIIDVIRRYDVDAVHLDDYFYPYPSGTCTAATFPDSLPYARYLAAGGTLARDAWRRDNIDRFIERLYRDVHAAAPLVRVGVSPFGSGVPGIPRDRRARFVRDNLRRFAEVAPVRVGRLSRPAALLVDHFDGSELRRPPWVVGAAERDATASLAGTRELSGGRRYGERLRPWRDRRAT